MICDKCSDTMVDVSMHYRFGNLSTWFCAECGNVSSRLPKRIQPDPPADPQIEAMAVSTDQSTVIRTSPSP
jgi:hypothetical protein